MMRKSVIKRSDWRGWLISLLCIDFVLCTVRLVCAGRKARIRLIRRFLNGVVPEMFGVDVRCILCVLLYFFDSRGFS